MPSAKTEAAEAASMVPACRPVAGVSFRMSMHFQLLQLKDISLDRS
jgi:hypothetical protein